MDHPAEANAPQLPLVALLGRAHDVFVAQFDALLAASEFRDLSLAHSRNVLRHLIAAPVRASHIVQCCGVSKQAVSQQLAHLQARGYVELTADPADGRARLVWLTDKGRRAQRLVHELFARVEDEWAQRLGPEEHVALRRTLSAIAATSGGARR